MHLFVQQLFIECLFQPRTASKKGQAAFTEFPVGPATWMLPQSHTCHLQPPHPLNTRKGIDCRRRKEGDAIGRGLGYFITKYYKEKVESKRDTRIKDQQDMSLFF